MGRHVVEIVSPVPPTPTGPADYLAKLLARLACIPEATCRIVVGADLSASSANGVELHGADVVDYRMLAPEVPIGRTRIYSLANNAHHAFVHQSLERVRQRSQGRIIGLIHDASLFMVHRWRTDEKGETGFPVAGLARVTAAQYGEDAERLLDMRLRGSMPDIYEYVTSTQGTALDACHEIWTHSLFAAAKLVFETGLTTDMLPRIRVCQHPQSEPGRFSKAFSDDDGLFRIGCFGWVSATKRIAPVIEGLALAFDRLPLLARESIRLSVVGNRTDHDIDVLGLAAIHGLSDVVELVEGTSRADFETRQCTCDLVFNLRYPSCGETSGTFASAREGKAQMVVSRYQAFAELDGLYRTITTLPGLERLEIASAICDGFQQWAGEWTTRPRRSVSAVATVDRLVLAEIVAQAIAGRLCEA